MKKALSGILTVCVFAFVLTACSGYSKLLKKGTNGEKYNAALDFLNEGKNQKAIDLFTLVKPAYIGTTKQDSIDYFMGLAYYRNRDYETSGMIFNQYRQSYGNRRTPFLEDAEFLYADGLYRSSPRTNRDQSATMTAIVAADEYLGHYPESQYREYMLDNMEELQGKLKDKSYLNAKLYYEVGDYKAAVVSFRNSLERYPATKHREEMLYLITKSNYELARNSIPALQRERYMNVMESYYNYIGEFPEGKHTKEIKKMHQEAQEYISKLSGTESKNITTNTSDTEDGN